MHCVHDLGAGCGSSQPLLVFMQVSRLSMSTACPLAEVDGAVVHGTCLHLLVVCGCQMRNRDCHPIGDSTGCSCSWWLCKPALQTLVQVWALDPSWEHAGARHLQHRRAGSCVVVLAW